MVYTYVGDIIVSVNPFKNTGCTGAAIRAKYRGGSRSHLPPHIYALVDQTYNTMVRDGHSQSILISGESGAGKTEAMKICLTYIGAASQAKGQRVADEVAPRLMMTNPIMEGLGAAPRSPARHSRRPRTQARNRAHSHAAYPMDSRRPPRRQLRHPLRRPRCDAHQSCLRSRARRTAMGVPVG